MTQNRFERQKQLAEAKKRLQAHSTTKIVKLLRAELLMKEILRWLVTT